NKGVWRDSAAATPDEGLNTVLLGHRFTYGGPAVFYHFEKLQVGDRIVVYWEKQKYSYEIESILEVPPTAVELVKKEVGEERLTLYTCTPLVTAKNRLVIQARPLETEEHQI